MTIALTGMAGFIGFHAARRLEREGHRVVGVDDLNSYYDTGLKYDRLRQLGINASACRHGELIESTSRPNISFLRLDISDREQLGAVLRESGVDVACHLAAQAGVRYSLEAPEQYVSTNIAGTLNFFLACRDAGVGRIVYASSSSVYGLEKQMPFGEEMSADTPTSLYAASKRSSELIAHALAHIDNMDFIGLRFFTVYGPWGRPDMAPMLFARAMLAGEQIKVFNNGEMSRDFTYIDDIVEGIVRVLTKSQWPGGSSRIYNIGNGSPVKLMDFIGTLESELGITANKMFMPMQPGDVKATWADCTRLREDYGYAPSTPLEDGVRAFISWYKDYYKDQL